MAGEFLETDRLGGLNLIAELYQSRWTSESAREVTELAKEIRLQEARFGLSPTDRARLHWTVTPEAEAVDEPAGTPDTFKRPKGKDPREMLKLA